MILISAFNSIFSTSLAQAGAGAGQGYTRKTLQEYTRALSESLHGAMSRPRGRPPGSGGGSRTMVCGNPLFLGWMEGESGLRDALMYPFQ